MCNKLDKQVALIEKIGFDIIVVIELSHDARWHGWQ